MKLGLAVVYLVRDDSEPLLRLHLARIRRHTTVPYVIHGVALRLPERFLPHLQAPDIRLHAITPPPDALSHVEHSALLTGLLDHALAEGCTHVGTLHVDSFPVADGWAEWMAGRLTPAAPVAAILEEMEGDTSARPNLAGMMATAEYWRQARPFLVPPPELEPTPSWRGFMERHRQHVTHSGVGLGYCLEAEGLAWTAIRRTNGRDRHPVLAGIYGSRLFHLGAATRPRSFLSDVERLVQPASMLRRRRMAQALRNLLPKPARRLLRHLRPVGRLYDNRPQERNEAIFGEIRRELFEDPERFLENLLRDTPGHTAQGN